MITRGWRRTAPVACLVLAGVAACSRQPLQERTEAVPARSTPAAARLPDLAGLDPALQEQLRSEYAAIDTAAAGSERAERYGRVGRLLLAAELPAAAEPFFVNARALNGGDRRWPYYLGYVQTALHQPESAAAAFADAVRLDPNNVPALLRLADSHLALGRPQDAEPHLVRAVELDPSSVAGWFHRGRAALATGDGTRAVDYLERALALDPNADAVHYQLGLAYRAAGNRAKAEAHLQRRAAAATVAPVDPLIDSLPALLQTGGASLARGLDAMERRDWTAAVGHLRQASERSPRDGVVHLNLGTALYLAGDAAAARRALETAVRLAPELPKAHYTLGLMAEAAGGDAEAIERFSVAVRLDADYVEAHASLADALRRSGRVEASLAHYARVLASDPAASQARFGYAMALVRLQRYREARDWLRQAAALHGEQPGFAHALARVLAAAPDQSVRNGREALQLTDQLLQAHRSPALSETRAMALAELGAFDEAIRWQEEAMAAARASGQAGAAERMQGNLARYRRREACRIPWALDDPVHHPRPSA